jgi:hypothetical protein
MRTGPQGTRTKSDRAREMYARGERSNRVIADACGLTPAGVWHALRSRPMQTVSAGPESPTFAENQLAMRLATMRGEAVDRATEIAKELAKARVAASQLSERKVAVR